MSELSPETGSPVEPPQHDLSKSVTRVDAPESGDAVSGREGLPSGYRMRADAHYVDQLTARRPVRASTDEPRVPIRQPDATDGAPAAGRSAIRPPLLATLEQELATVEALAGSLVAELTPFARQAATDLLRAQLFRARWALRADALCEGRAAGDLRSRPLLRLLARLEDAFAPEGRLSGATLRIQGSDWQAVVLVDEQAVLTGLAGAIFATIALAGADARPGIRMSVVAAGGQLRSVDVTQEEATPAPEIRRRFFDGAWHDRPGGWLTALGAAAAEAAARRHGGEATLVPGERRGSILRLTFGRVA